MKAVLRPLAAIAAIAAGLIGVAGCNTDPSAAAIVGGDRISISTLQDAVNTALDNAQVQAAFGSDRVAFTRTELGRLVSYRVVAAAAAAHGITATPTDVQNQIQAFTKQAGTPAQLYQSAASQGGIPPSALPAFVRNFVLEQKLAAQLMSEHPVTAAEVAATYHRNIDTYKQVHAAHILVSSPTKAQQLLTEVKAHPDRFAALAKKYSLDKQSAKNGGDLGFAGPTAFVKPFSDAIFSAKPGSYLVVQSQFGYHVVHVIADKVQPFQQVAASIRTQLESARKQQLLQAALTAEAAKLGVQVNPRYGRYDPAQAIIVPVSPSTGVSSPLPTQSPTAPVAPVGP